MIAQLARRALAGFIAWRHRRRVAKTIPVLVDLKRLESERRKKHQPVRDIHKTRRAIVHARLASELSATLPDRRFS